MHIMPGEVGRRTPNRRTYIWGRLLIVKVWSTDLQSVFIGHNHGVSMSPPLMMLTGVNVRVNVDQSKSKCWDDV